MPIDSRDKRSSAVLVGMPWRGQLPVPDGAALNQGDRQQVGLMYRGIAAAGGPAPAATSVGYWLHRARRRIQEDDD